MAILHHEKYTLISRPHFDTTLKGWIPYASVWWDDDEFHYYRLNKFEQTFGTEDEAVAFGFTAARAWIVEYEAGRSIPGR